MNNESEIPRSAQTVANGDFWSFVKSNQKMFINNPETGLVEYSPIRYLVFFYGTLMRGFWNYSRFGVDT